MQSVTCFCIQSHILLLHFYVMAQVRLGWYAIWSDVFRSVFPPRWTLTGQVGLHIKEEHAPYTTTTMDSRQSLVLGLWFFLYTNLTAVFKSRLCVAQSLYNEVR